MNSETTQSYTILKPLLPITTLQELVQQLQEPPCTRCNLGLQPGLQGPCISRGEPATGRMLIGEAPGRYEDALSEPFTGPAGQLLDKIFEAVGWDTNADWYLTNVVLCRPIAAQGSGKENFTPKVEQRERCRPFLDKQIELIQPHIIVTVGGVATQALFRVGQVRMKDYRGRLVEIDGIKVFPMLHPAAILHAQGQPELYSLYRKQTWEDIQKLKQIVDEIEGELNGQ